MCCVALVSAARDLSTHKSFAKRWRSFPHHPPLPRAPFRTFPSCLPFRLSREQDLHQSPSLLPKLTLKRLQASGGECWTTAHCPTRANSMISPRKARVGAILLISVICVEFVNLHHISDLLQKCDLVQEFWTRGRTLMDSTLMSPAPSRPTSI